MSLARFRAVGRGRIDPVLLLSILALVAFGLVMVSSASVVVAWREFGSNYFFLTKQLWAAVLGLSAFAIVSLIDYHRWQRIAPFVGLVILALLILPYLPGIGVELQGARSWVDIGPIFFQPSELVKILSILYLAAWLANRNTSIGDTARSFLPFAITVFLITLLIFIQPDAGTAVTLVTVLVLIYFVAGAPLTHLGYLAVIGLIGLLLILQAPYRAERIQVLLNVGDETLGAGYHVNQALLAIGSGGWFGLGFGQSNQKYLFLPEAHTDSIFAVAVEELGFLRSLAVLALFGLIIYRGLWTARRAPDQFGRLTAFGVTALFGVQSLVNIGAMLNLLPLTGVTLPLVSYGGSSLLTLLFGLGILMNITKHAAIERAGP